jgi:hypothetical protein
MMILPTGSCLLPAPWIWIPAEVFPGGGTTSGITPEICGGGVFPENEGNGGGGTDGMAPEYGPGVFPQIG